MDATCGTPRGFGFRMIGGSLAVAVHAIFPFLFTPHRIEDHRLPPQRHDYEPCPAVRAAAEERRLMRGQTPERQALSRGAKGWAFHRDKQTHNVTPVARDLIVCFPMGEARPKSCRVSSGSI